MHIILHITNEIKEFIYGVGRHIDSDVVIIEAGTIYDIEGQQFIEVIRKVGLLMLYLGVLKDGSSGNGTIGITYTT